MHHIMQYHIVWYDTIKSYQYRIILKYPVLSNDRKMFYLISWYHFNIEPYHLHDLKMGNIKHIIK